VPKAPHFLAFLLQGQEVEVSSEEFLEILIGEEPAIGAVSQVP
jgi:hypothetical protein